MIDGPTLMSCKSVDDVKEFGITLTAKARIYFEEITKYKMAGVINDWNPETIEF